jgi:hypothetical protein
MRFDQRLLPTASTPSTRASRVPSIFSRLAPRSPYDACAPERETGRPCASRREGQLGRAARVRVWRCRPYTPEPAVPSDAPVAHRPGSVAFATKRSPTCRDHSCECPVKGNPPLWSETSSIESSPASTAGGTGLVSGHVRVSASSRCRCPVTPDRSCSRTPGPTLRRPSPNGSKSCEVEPPASLRQDNQPSTSATTNTTRERDPERPILASARGGRAFPPAPYARTPASRTCCSARTACDTPRFRRRGGSEPRTTYAAVLVPCKTIREYGAVDHRSSRRHVRGGAPSSTVGCAEDGRDDDEMVTWADEARVKDRPSRS